MSDASPIKIFNDPVHGFIEMPRGPVLSLIDHPYFQRLRYIRQLGLSDLVYPGAVHTRFNHALGALHLTQEALKTLKDKDVAITEEEETATQIAILLHDIGHGPFSHGLEGVLVADMHHERMSRLLMERLSADFGDELRLAIRIFSGDYEKPFLHQLIASQLDMDRMDYLMRDSFFTGVQEGIVGTDRIIKTLNVREGKLVVEEKGIYSVEKFIVARRLMYWQVYLHKTGLAAEVMLLKILELAKQALQAGIDLPGVPPLKELLALQQAGPYDEQRLVDCFVQLGDDDVLSAIKQWQHVQAAPLLADLCYRLVHRRLFKLRFAKEPFSNAYLQQLRERFQQELGLSEEALEAYVVHGEAQNLAYLPGADQPISILKKDGRLLELAQAADVSNIQAMGQTVTKYYVCTPGH
jgi:HD superfamily phosphohydrolase